MDVSIRKELSALDLGKKCERCLTYGHYKEARGYCVQCKENICTSCIDYHKRMITSHKILDLRESDTLKTRGKSYNDANEICREHGKRIEYFCKAHDVRGCSTCMVFDHIRCTIEYVYIRQELKDDAHVFSKLGMGQLLQPAIHYRRNRIFDKNNKASLESLHMSRMRRIPDGEDASNSSLKSSRLGTVGNQFDPLICSWTVKDVNTLIKDGKLPTQRTLDEMCQVLGKNSKAILITCNAICGHIKSMHDDIVHVWASYTPQNQERIIFVINMKEKTMTKPDTKSFQINKIEYSFVKRYFGEFNQESYDIKKQQDSFEWLDEDAYQAVSHSISKYSRYLMKKHKYLSVISACPYRSKSVDGSSWKLLPKSCIVFYVLIKGYIPIDEDPFEKTYDGIPIDVREGVFIPFGRTARDKLDPITMGCQIRGEINDGKFTEGSIGCFIDHPQFGCCGLTCAHVLLNAGELEQLKTSYGGALKWPLDDLSKTVYQPADTSQSSSIGRIVQLIFKEGSDKNCGMELALFRITDRKPQSASFPDATEISDPNIVNGITYDNWQICSASMLNATNKRVLKFGSKTELRDGILEFDNASVKELNGYPLKVAQGDGDIKLFKQIMVTPHSSDRFASFGDSGALVFLDESNEKHTCIGIVEGGISNGTEGVKNGSVVVTPIVPILNELNVACLKKFELETDVSNVHNRVVKLESSVQEEFQTVKTKLQNVDSKLQNLEKGNEKVHTMIEKLLERIPEKNTHQDNV